MEKLRLNCVRAWRPTVSKRTPKFYNYTYKLKRDKLYIIKIKNKILVVHQFFSKQHTCIEKKMHHQGQIHVDWSRNLEYEQIAEKKLIENNKVIFSNVISKTHIIFRLIFWFESV